MRIEIICLGTELLKDKINTNSNLIAEKLFSIGLSVSQVTTVGDSAFDIETALKQAVQRSVIIITCGGLGPTFDDLTRECAAKVLHRPLIFSTPILKQIQRRFVSVQKTMPEENKRQAYLIRGAKAILNKAGTAPGQIIEHQGKCLILLPGPPKELIPMIDQAIGPYLKKKYPGTFVKQVVLHIHGYPESEIDEMIRPAAQKNWNQKDLKVTFGILAHQSIIDVKASVEGNKVQRVQEVLNRIEDELRKILGSRVYGKNEETLEQAVGHLLRKRGEQLAIAESCTGGLIADQITNIPGSSDYFKEGVVAYSNESKIKRLRVSSQTLQKFGAVSEPTAGEMAKGILKTSGADWGIAVTGIAGPGGGTKEKPAGLVCFAIASPKNVQSWTRRFFGSRTEIKQKSALMALDLLRQQLKLQPNPTKYSDS